MNDTVVMETYVVLVIYGALLTVAYTRTCNVCVMQPVITSSIKCPPCNISYGKLEHTHMSKIYLIDYFNRE